eukprot:CAMPEP_0204581066 /NCGR_PEP_ID=MMETSP0661-20131031/44424_1 /ASSEMBLY_ACC=CAM_ASM_000606 /TAXON_ID=109239 /ORGANISM="Alexandrium margalefi, Strain AMGDE01CS-322" /LENGTH=47 /DNA_ID= /DNA_START= /DNA_END= /DNA_ORIENTATION=
MDSGAASNHSSGVTLDSAACTVRTRWHSAREMRFRSPGPPLPPSRAE